MIFYANTPFLTPQEIYTKTKILHVPLTKSSNSYDIYDQDSDFKIELTPGANTHKVTAPAFTSYIKYNGTFNTNTSKYENGQSTLGFFWYGDYLIYDIQYCFFTSAGLYTFAYFNTFDYSTIYTNWYSSYKIYSFNASNIVVNNTYNVKYTNISNLQYPSAITYIKPNTIFNTYNYTENGTSIISALNDKTNIPANDLWLVYDLNGIAQKNIFKSYLWGDVYDRTVYPDTTLNANTTWFFNTDYTTNRQQVTRPELIYYGIHKNVIDNAITDNTNDINNALTLIDTTITNANNIVIAPYLTVTLIITGLMGVGIFKLIKGFID